MKLRLSSVIGWLCVGLVAAFHVFAIVMKFIPLAPGSEGEEFAKRLGTYGLEYPLGVMEILIVLLYVIPRTSTVGFVLMVGYMGGALATNLTHGFPLADCTPLFVLFALMTLGAYFRNPELLTRIQGKKA